MPAAGQARRKPGAAPVWKAAETRGRPAQKKTPQAPARLAAASRQGVRRSPPKTAGTTPASKARDTKPGWLGYVDLEACRVKALACIRADTVAVIMSRAIPGPGAERCTSVRHEYLWAPTSSAITRCGFARQADYSSACVFSSLIRSSDSQSPAFRSFSRPGTSEGSNPRRLASSSTPHVPRMGTPNVLAQRRASASSRIARRGGCASA